MNTPFLPNDRALLTTSHHKSLSGIVERWKAKGARIAFVPTMGALHEGHLSLMKIAAQKADKVVVSIFVNPAQFAPHEDFESYPRDLDADLQLMNTGVDLVYTPAVEEIYPATPSLNPTAFSEREDAQRQGEGEAAEHGLESDFRPHFFSGVKDVVRILFNQVQPDIAVFGEKDFQQMMVIREMVKHEKMPVEIIAGPIIRDEHGLALSSRNQYLSIEDLEIARMLNQILYKAAFDLSALPPLPTAGKASGLTLRIPPPHGGRLGGEEDTAEILNNARTSLLTTGFDKVDYVAFKPEWNRVLAAAWIGKTRLIDNCPLHEKGTE